MDDIIRRLGGQLSLRQGASQEALEELQRRLGVRLPEDYLAFLGASDGAEGPLGEWSYVALCSVAEVVARNEGLARLRDGLLIFGSDGAEEAYAFDLRGPAMRVVEIPYEVMGTHEPAVRADTFAEFLRYLERN